METRRRQEESTKELGKRYILRLKVLNDTVIFDERTVLLERCIYRMEKMNDQKIGNGSYRGLGRQKIRKEWKKVY